STRSATNRRPVTYCRQMCLSISLMLALLPLSAQTPERQRSVAITIDDGPAVTEMKDLGAFQRIARGLLSSLEAEKVPATIFINERQINVQGQRDGRAAVLAQWLDAGYDLGNHGYAHASANRVSLREFEDDIVRGDVIMRPMMAERNRQVVWFRYPFLNSGETAEAHQAIMDFLEQHH